MTELPEVRYGDSDAKPKPDLDEEELEEELPETPPDVAALLGFDPLDEAE